MKDWIVKFSWLINTCYNKKAFFFYRTSTYHVSNMFDLLLSFLGFWVVAHAVCHFIQQRLHSKVNFLITLFYHINNFSKLIFYFFEKKRTFTSSFFRTTTNIPATRSLSTSLRPTTFNLTNCISNQPFHIRFTTNRLNPYFKSFANLVPNFWQIWFSIGVFVGIITMIIGIIVMIVAGWKLITGFLAIVWNFELNTSQITTSRNLAKRNFIEENIGKDDTEDHQVFVPVASKQKRNSLIPMKLNLNWMQID